MCLTAKHMAKGQLAHLLSGSLNNFLVAIAQRRAPEPGHAFKIFVALIIPDITAFTALKANLLYGLKVGGWVN